MMKHFISLLITLLLYQAGQAQFWEPGVRIGVSNYEGDLSPFAFTLSENHLASGLFIRMNINDRFSVRSSLFFGTISGDDDNFNDARDKTRNLSFRSRIYEFSIMPEFFLFSFDNCDRPFSPYLFAGIALFHFNPEAYYRGEWIALQPLGTEGQGTSEFPRREKYDLTQISIPFGVGMKVGTKSGFNFGLEASFRKTFTDYLDDVSKTYADPAILAAENGQLSPILSNRTGEVNDEPRPYSAKSGRGDPGHMDWYLSAELLISYTIGTTCGKKSNFDSKGRPKKNYCPIW